MRVSSQVRVWGAMIALLAVVGVQVAAQADDKAAGETWHQTMSMEMTGMTMPSRSLDVCVPPGKVDEALTKPQGPGTGGNCSVQDVKHDGSKYSATFMCTGKQPVQGTIEAIHEGDHFRATMTMSFNGQQMTIKTESQKTGTPCTPKTLPNVK